MLLDSRPLRSVFAFAAITLLSSRAVAAQTANAPTASNPVHTAGAIVTTTGIITFVVSLGALVVIAAQNVCLGGYDETNHNFDYCQPGPSNTPALIGLAAGATVTMVGIALLLSDRHPAASQRRATLARKLLTPRIEMEQASSRSETTSWRTGSSVFFPGAHVAPVLTAHF